MGVITVIAAFEEAWLPFERSRALSSLFTGLAMMAGLMLVYFYTPYWRLRKLPGPPANLLLGHLPLIVKHGKDMCTILAKEYGPVFKIRMGRQPIVVVADPELCRDVGIKNFKSFPNRGIPSSITSSPFLGKALFTSRDERWAAMRNTVLSLYQPSAIASTILAMQSYVESATRHVFAAGEDEDIDFSDILYRMATDVIGKSAFGVEFGLLSDDMKSTGKENEMTRAFLEAHECCNTNALKMHLNSSFSSVLAVLFPILEIPARKVLQRLPWTADYKIHQANKLVAERVDEIVAERAKGLERGSTDFISAILRARESDGPKRELFTPDYIRSLAYEHVLAGTSSTAFSLSTVLYLISKHPEVEKKLVQEIDGFGPHDVVPNADDLQNKFPYLDQVIRESQRFYSNSPMTARKASKQVEVGGYVLPKGTWVWLALDYLAQDPKNFPEPEAFRPERFDPNCEEQKRRHPYALIPFGLGPRMCIGMKFALQEIKLAVISLYRKFTFTHSPNMESPVEFEYGGVLVTFKHGLKLRAKRRLVLQ